MAAPLIAAGVGAAANVVGGYLAGKAAEKAAKEAAAIQQANFAKLQQQLEAIGIPSRVAQEIALTDPEYAGDLIAEQLGDTKLAEVQVDPAMRQRRMDAIRSLEERSITGLTGAEKAQLADLRDQTGAQAKAQDQAILSQMAQSGTLDSGAALAQRLMASQAATQRQAQASRDLAAEASNRRFAAVQALGQQAGELENTDYGRASDIARNRDVISEANARNRMSANQYNLGRKDSLAAQKSSNRNEEERFNKGLIQKEYENKMGQFNTIAGIQTGSANAQAGAIQAAGQGKAQMYSGIGSGIADVAGAYGKQSYDTQQRQSDRQFNMQQAEADRQHNAEQRQLDRDYRVNTK